MTAKKPPRPDADKVFERCQKTVERLQDDYRNMTAPITRALPTQKNEVQWLLLERVDDLAELLASVKAARVFASPEDEAERDFAQRLNKFTEALVEGALSLRGIKGEFLNDLCRLEPQILPHYARQLPPSLVLEGGKKSVNLRRPPTPLVREICLSFLNLWWRETGEDSRTFYGNTNGRSRPLTPCGAFMKKCLEPLGIELKTAERYLKGVTKGIISNLSGVPFGLFYPLTFRRNK